MQQAAGQPFLGDLFPHAAALAASSARPLPVQVTVEACDREIKPINERVDEANRVLQAT